MAWQDEMVQMLRVMINDLDATPTYSDDRLEQLLAVAAKYVDQEIDFDNDYTIDVSTRSISPDPTVTATKEDAFTNFVVLKAACLTDLSTFRTKAALNNLKAKCGPAVLETVRHMDGFKELLDKGPCAAYDKLKTEWAFGNAQVCRVILSPFVSNNFDPQALSTWTERYGDRHR